jgi:phospholipid transport system substrate-binding protein
MENDKAMWIALILFFSLCFYFSIPSPLGAGAPMDQVRTAVDRVLIILQDPGLKSERKKGERVRRLRQVIYPRFDFGEMAKRSLGNHWRQRTPEQQREFVKIFTDLLEKLYVGKIESYNGERIVYTREVQDKNYAEVNTKIITKKEGEVPINYRLHGANGEWKVYDVVIENVSLVNNYRSQFNRILASASFGDLIKRLQEKNKELRSDMLRVNPSVPHQRLFARALF